MEIIFTIDGDLKQEYLKTKPTKTAQSDAFVLRSADEYEQLVEKSIYDFTLAEVREMMAMQFRNTSVNAVLKNASILKGYVDFCIGKNVVVRGENRLELFTKEEAEKVVNRQALLSKYINKEQLRECQNMLYNDQDKLLLGLLYIGVRGDALDELINLTIDDLDEEDKLLTISQGGKHRMIEIDYSTIELIKDTYNQEVYVENNGELTNNPRIPKPREMKINKVKRFVFRIPGKNKFEKFNPSLLNSRMKKIQKYCGNAFLTYTSIYQSGMIQSVMDIYKDKGEVTKEEIIEICDRFNYGDSPEKYWFVVKDLFEQYKNLLGN